MLKKFLCAGVIVSLTVFNCGADESKKSVKTLPSVMSDAEFQQILTKGDSKELYKFRSRVADYLLNKAAENSPELQGDITDFLQNLNNIKVRIRELAPDKAADITKLEKKNYNFLRVPRLLSRLIPYDKWNDSKLHSYYLACAKLSENINIMMMEKTSKLPEGIAWKKFMNEQQKKRRLAAISAPYVKNLGRRKNDFAGELKEIQDILTDPASSKSKKRQNVRRAEFFLKDLKRRVTSPEIIDLELKAPPVEMEIEVLKQRNELMLGNLDDAVELIYGNFSWGREYSKKYEKISNKLNGEIQKLPAVQKKSKWYKDKNKKIDSMKAELLKDTSNPQVADYLKAEKVLSPYLEKK